MNYSKSLYQKGSKGKEKETNWKAHLEEAAIRHSSVAGSVALDRRPLPEAVAPLLDHVKPLGVPDVSF